MNESCTALIFTCITLLPGISKHGYNNIKKGVVNRPLKIEKSRQILPKSRTLAQHSNGSWSLRFCVDLSVTYMLFYQVTKLFGLGLGF